MSNEKKTGWKERLLEELKKLSIIAVYLWVLLSVFVVYRAIILNDYHISDPEKLGFALINALILAKFILIADAFHAGKKFESLPLLYSILFKSALFSVILMVCHIVEEVLVRMWHGKSFVESLPEVGGAALNDIFSLGIIMFVVLIPFFTARELIRVLGKDTLKALLLARGGTTGILQTKV